MLFTIRMLRANGPTRELKFEIRKNSSLRAAMLKVCHHFKLDLKHLGFKYQNRVVKETDTPYSLKLDENAVVLAFKKNERISNLVSEIQDEDNETVEESLDLPNFINLTLLLSWSGQKLHLRVTKTCELEQVLIEFCKKSEVDHPIERLRFRTKNPYRAIDAYSTALDLDLDSGSTILVHSFGVGPCIRCAFGWAKHINYKITDGEKEVWILKANVHSTLKNAMKAYSLATDMDMRNIRFLRHGNHLSEGHTPYELGFGFDDVIYASYVAPVVSWAAGKLVDMLMDDGEHKLSLKINAKSKLGNAMAAYCSAYDLDIKCLRFEHNGRSVKDEETPFDLSVDDQFTLNVHHIINDPDASILDFDKIINLTIGNGAGKELKLKFNERSPFKNAMIAYSVAHNLEVNRLNFLYNGQRITEDDTPVNMKFDSNSYVDVIIDDNDS